MDFKNEDEVLTWLGQEWRAAAGPDAIQPKGGAVPFVIGSDGSNDRVMMRFPFAIEWLEMPSKGAVNVVVGLLEHARRAGLPDVPTLVKTREWGDEPSGPGFYYHNPLGMDETKIQLVHVLPDRRGVLEGTIIGGPGPTPTRFMIGSWWGPLMEPSGPPKKGAASPLRIVQ